MGRQMNMPIKAEVEALNQENSGNRSKSILYNPLPLGQNATTKMNNKLFMGLFSPAKWSLFQQENHPILLPNPVPSDMWSFYFKISGHYVDAYDPAGKKRSQFILCPSEMNKYLTEVLKFKPLFKDGRCRYCEENKAWWGKFESHWPNATLNGQKVNPDRWSYDRDGFNAIMKENPNLNQMKEEAGRWGAGPRWVFLVFDVAKLQNERPFDEGETGVDYQYYMGPKTVFEACNNLYENGVQFYDVDNPQIVSLVKDCSQGGPRNAKYQVQTLGSLNVNAEEKKYLSDDNSIPDLPWGEPFSEGTVVCVLSYEEQAKFGQLFAVGAGQGQGSPVQNVQPTQPATTSATAPVQPAPQEQVGGASQQTPAAQPGAPAVRRRGQNAW